jgi:hypothetical protein
MHQKPRSIQAFIEQIRRSRQDFIFYFLLFTFYFFRPFALFAEKLHNKSLFKAMKFLSNTRLLLLGVWFGAAVFFSFAVAPSAFAVLPSREVAGMMVSRSLTIVNISGLVIGLILLATSFAGTLAANRILLWAERILLIILPAACALGLFIGTFWLPSVKAQMGRPIDEVALEDPLRIQFNNLHEYSVWVLVAGMVAALIAFFLIAGKTSAPPPAAAKTTSDPFDFDKEFKKS